VIPRLLPILLVATAALSTAADDAKQAEAAKLIGRAWELRGKPEGGESAAKSCAAIRELYPRLANPMQVASASAGEDEGRPIIRMTLTDEGAVAMEKLTTENLHKRLAIVFGRKVLMAPTIQSTIRKELTVTGVLEKADVKRIVEPLNVDRLPCRLEPAGTMARIELKPGEDPWAPETFADRLIGNPLVHAILEDVLRDREPVAYGEILKARESLEKRR